MEEKSVEVLQALVHDSAIAKAALACQRFLCKVKSARMEREDLLLEMIPLVTIDDMDCVDPILKDSLRLYDGSPNDKLSINMLTGKPDTALNAMPTFFRSECGVGEVTFVI